MLSIGLLSSMVQAILPGKIQLRFLQQEQISSVKKDLSYQGYVILGNLSRWQKWQKHSTAGISDDHPNRCFHKRVKSTLQMNLNRGGNGQKKDQGHGINVLKLMSVKFAILTFTKNLSNVTVHIQMDNKFALSCILKMGGTHILEL